MGSSRAGLLEILRQNSLARRVLEAPPPPSAFSEIEPFPFLAVIGQPEMKLALLLAVINPNVGGVLLIGARGTAKTTAVRSLTDLLPPRRRSLCSNGCTEASLEVHGLEGICPDCAKKVGYGQPLSVEDKVRIVELPLNARLEDVLGSVNERVLLEQQRMKLDRGILSVADGNVLYIDEVNLLEGAVSDAILDAASQGYFTVRRGPLKTQYQSRFVLVGTMNPEEGYLRPQILDRFGLRAVVRGLPDPESRFLAYQQAMAFNTNPESLGAAYADQTMALAEELAAARSRIPDVVIGESSKGRGLALIESLEIDSGRAEIALFEAARAYAAADERLETAPGDIAAVAPMALRLRRNTTLGDFLSHQDDEDQKIRDFFVDDWEEIQRKKDRSTEN